MGKHIHIINPYGSAAMIRMVAPLTELLPRAFVVAEGKEPDPEADLNYHVPYHTLVGYEGGGKQAMLYTHVNPSDEMRLRDACERADLIICMSFTGRDELIERGVDPEKIWVIYAAAEGFGARRRNIGIVGYEQPNARKRSHILLDLAWQMDLTPFHFVICGMGWDGVVKQLQTMGVSVEHHEHLDWTEMPKVYASLDALLVTAYAEGGPLPLLEAMACGLPVIAPPVGYAKDLSLPTYETADELVVMLDNMIAPIRERQQVVSMWTWKDYAEEHARAFGRLLGERPDLFENSGASRYMQLLDIIKERKPQHIAEVGTWNGNNALRMIQEAQKYREDVWYTGFDLFNQQTLADVRKEFSKGAFPKGAVQKRLNATGADVELIEGNTRETLIDIDADLFFIDGGHSAETIKNDWRIISECMGAGAVAVFDDYYIGDHPKGIGCNEIIDNLSLEWDVEKLPEVTDTGKVKIAMVKVRQSASLYLQV